MAIGLWIRFEGGTQEQYDAVNAQMGVEQDPPEGFKEFPVYNYIKG